MDFTGERFIPDVGLDSELAVEHYQRYHAVLDLLANKVVLDAAAGEGYGSDLLAGSAQTVCGLEIDPQAVLQARGKYQRPNLHFIQGTIAGLPFHDGTFDAAVSFETIEHVAEGLQEAFVKEVKRVLKPGGFLLISTPDKRLYSDLPGYHNEFHIKEFYRQEFHDFLTRHFTTVKFWEQSAMLAYVLTDGRGEELRQLMPDADVQGRYIVALCSDSVLPEARLGSVAFDRQDLYRRKVERVVELQGEIDEKNQHLWTAEGHIDKIQATALGLQQTVQDLQQTITEQNRQAEGAIASLEGHLAKSQQRVAELESALDQSAARLTHIEATKAWRLIKALYRMKDRVRGLAR